MGSAVTESKSLDVLCLLKDCLGCSCTSVTCPVGMRRKGECTSFPWEPVGAPVLLIARYQSCILVCVVLHQIKSVYSTAETGTTSPSVTKEVLMHLVTL